MCFELELDCLSHRRKDHIFDTKVFPEINRDFAFAFDSQASVGNLVGSLKKLDDRIKRASIFDCFDMADGKKSVGVSAVLGANDRTLTENEAQEISEKIVKHAENIGGELRQK